MNWASLSTISGLLKNNIGEVRISRPWPSIMLTTLVLATSANIAQGETIFDAIGSVTKSHPAVIAATKLMAAAHSERREAISGYMPTLSIDGRTGQQSRDRISGNTSLYSNELSLSLRQPLFDGFKTRNAVRAAGAAEAEAKSEMEMRTLRVAFEAARTYIDVLRANELAASAGAYRKRVDDLAQRIGQRADADPGLRSNLTLGQSRQLEADIQLETAQSRRQLATDRYRELFGKSAAGLKAVSLANLDIPKSSEQALLIGQKTHPVAKTARAATERQSALTDAERSNLFPRLDLEVSGRVGNNLDGVSGRDNSLFAGLRLSYKFETGGGAQHRVDSFNYRAEAAMENERDTLLQLREQILHAWSEWRIASDIYKSVVKRRENADRMVADYQGQFEAGNRELLDFFFILTEQQAAVETEINARHDRNLGAFKLMTTIGIIPRS